MYVYKKNFFHTCMYVCIFFIFINMSNVPFGIIWVSERFSNSYLQHNIDIYRVKSVTSNARITRRI